MAMQEHGNQFSPALVGIAGSAGGTAAVRQILPRLPADFPAPIVYIQHLNGNHQEALIDVLQWHTSLQVRWAHHGDLLQAGVVYVCPAGYSLIVEPDATLSLTSRVTGHDVLHVADRLFCSMATSFGDRAIAIVLSGGCWDGTAGGCEVRAQGGTVLVQDEASALQWSMPRAAISSGCVDLVLPPQNLAPVLVSLVRDRYPLAALKAKATRLAQSRAVAVSSMLQNILDRLLASAMRAHGTDLGNVQLVDASTGTLAIVAQCGFGLDFLEHFDVVCCQDNSACGRALRERESVLIPDVTLDPLFAVHRSIAASAGFRAVQSIPIFRRDGALLGVLSTHFRSVQTNAFHLDRLPIGTSRLVEQLIQ